MGSKYGGYMGKVLDVDLSSGRVSEYPVSDGDREKYMGGKILAAKILYDELEPGIDPLGPENILVIMTGPLTGSGAPCTSRFDVSTKNVLTGGIASSNCGGTFGMQLKKAGCDGIVIRGRAARPTTIVITEHGVEFKDARRLWGKDTEETQHELEKSFGRGRGMAVIGPAGENLVRYACIVSGERAAGRCGVGAVMGAKNLKAMVAWGAKKVPVHDAAGFKKAVKKWVWILRNNGATGETLPKFGTANLVNAVNASGTMPTSNFRRGSFERADRVSGETMAEEFLVNNTGCVSCPIRCGRLVKLGDKVVKGPEYETLGMLGPNIENDDLGAIIEWNYRLDLLGMDTITAGATIACAMELNELGLWDNGLKFGETKNITGLLDDIAHRRGIGAEMAEGAMRLAEKYGAPGCAMHVKGLEFSAYEPRRAVGHGLGYATSNRGGCHINGGYMIFFEAIGPVTMDPQTPRSKPEFCVFQQNMLEAVGASGNCIFTTYALVPPEAGMIAPPASTAAKIVSDVLIASGAALHFQGRAIKDWMLPIHVPIIPHTETVSKLTGINMDLGHFAVAGERGFTLERIFNLREGIDALEDRLPSRLTDEPQSPDRPDTKVPIDIMMPVYYEVRDWDSRGVPTKRLTAKLGLEFAEAALEKARALAPDAEFERHKRLESEAATAVKIVKKQMREKDTLLKKQKDIAAKILDAERLEKVKLLRESRFYIEAERCRSCGLCAGVCPADAIIWTAGEPALIDTEKCVVCGKCYDACPPNFGAVAHEADKKVAARKKNMTFKVDAELCRMCGTCYRNCPTGAIEWEKKKTASIDQKYCVKCGTCRIVCPDKFNAVRMNGKLKEVNVT